MLKNVVKIANNYLETLLSRISIRKLFVILMLFFGGITITVFAVSTYKTMYKTVYEERIEKLKYVADFAIEILEYQDLLVKNHEQTMLESQKEAIAIMKRVRFENNDYIWINRYDGKMIYHPYSQLIGTNAAAMTDHNGFNFGKELVEITKNNGSGYVQYQWTKLLEPKNKYYSKVSYVKGFKPWGWEIGTGVYIDDINEKVVRTMFDGIMSVLLALILMLIIFRYIILATIVIPIEELADTSLKLARNDLNVTIPQVQKGTEFGDLYGAFNKFVDVFKEKRNSEKKLSLIYDSIADVLITINLNGVIKFVNPVIEEMFGYKVDEIIGKTVSLLTSPNIVDEEENVVKHKSGKYELLGIKKSEEFFNIEVSISEFLYNDEIMFILLIRDITKQKEIEKMKNEFVSVVSHELRTPLTSIRGSLGLLLSGIFPEIKDKVKTLLEVAHNNSLRLMSLINDILDLEKIEAGKMEFNFEETNVPEIIQQCISVNAPYAAKFNVSHKFSNKLPENCTFNVDRNRFTQILTNLLSNASKFSSENGEVLVTSELQDDFIQISIKDSGFGIPDGFKSKIFSKFTQADSSDSRQKGGTGLGLNICKSLVEQMGGEIGFDSVVGEGTTFYIKFPVLS